MAGHSNVMKRIVLALSAFALASCGSGPITASTIASLDTSAMIPVTDAIAIASNELPGGFVASAMLDLEDGTEKDEENEPLSYEVAIFVESTGELWHVGVDAKTGEIVEKEIEGSEPEEE
jgi:uncharacterized membrane protein YkoI